MAVFRVIDPTYLSLEEFKKARYQQIDEMTAYLISKGFTYQGKQFSMSKNAQINLLGLKMDKMLLTFPLRWNTIDDSDYYDIIDGDDADNFHLTSLGFKAGSLNAGTALKDQIRAATTKEEVALVIDNRS